MVNRIHPPYSVSSRLGIRVNTGPRIGVHGAVDPDRT